MSFSFERTSELLESLASLLEAREVFDKRAIESLRKDFLTLAKNIDRVKDYDEALKLKEAFKTWNEHFEQTIERLILELPYHVDAKLGDRTAGWAYDSGLWKRNREWDEYWEKKIRSGTWDLRSDAQVDLQLMGTGYQIKYWPDLTKEYAFSLFERKKKKWQGRLRRSARKAWNTLKEYEDWATDQGARQITLFRPEDYKLNIQGFQVVLKNVDDRTFTHSWNQDFMDMLDPAFKLYRQRAKQVLPLLLKSPLPFEIDFKTQLDKGGTYEGDRIVLYALSVKSPKEITKVIAHETGHHVWKTWLSSQDQKFWENAIKKDYGTIDLVRLAELWDKVSPKGLVSDISDYLKDRDPIMYLQFEALIGGFGLGLYGKGLFFYREELQELIDKGTTSYPVPKNPVTAYAAKNPEEAFCEAVGMLVAYGERAIPRLALEWLRVIFGSELKL